MKAQAMTWLALGLEFLVTLASDPFRSGLHCLLDDSCCQSMAFCGFVCYGVCGCFVVSLVLAFGFGLLLVILFVGARTSASPAFQPLSHPHLRTVCVCVCVCVSVCFCACVYVYVFVSGSQFDR
jgi:hypothetical protein